MFFWDKHKTITNCYEMIARSVCMKYQLMQIGDYEEKSVNKNLL